MDWSWLVVPYLFTIGLFLAWIINESEAEMGQTERGKKEMKEKVKMSGETFGLLIMVFSLFWMIGFMFGEEVAIICVLWALLQSFIGYVIGMRGLFKTFEEEATKNE